MSASLVTSNFVLKQSLLKSRSKRRKLNQKKLLRPRKQKMMTMSQKKKRKLLTHLTYFLQQLSIFTTLRLSSWTTRTRRVKPLTRWSSNSTDKVMLFGSYITKSIKVKVKLCTRLRIFFKVSSRDSTLSESMPSQDTYFLAKNQTSKSWVFGFSEALPSHKKL
jgi:hypothetical protein